MSRSLTPATSNSRFRKVPIQSNVKQEPDERTVLDVRASRQFRPIPPRQANFAALYVALSTIPKSESAISWLDSLPPNDWECARCRISESPRECDREAVTCNSCRKHNKRCSRVPAFMEATIMGALDLTPKSYNHALVRYESNCGRKVTAGRRQMITPPKRHDLQCSVKEQDERKNEADHVLNYANEEILTGFACQRDSFTPPSYGDATSLHYLQTDELEYPQQLSADSTLRASHDAEFTMPGSSIWPVLSPVQSSCHEIVDADRLICWDVSSSQDELGSWAGDKPDIIRQLECSTKPVGTYTAAGRDINLDRRVFDWLEDIDGNPDYAAFEEPVVVESSIAEDIHSCGLLLAEVHTRLRNWCDVMSQASQKLQTVRNRLLEEEDRPLDVAHLGDSERPLLSNIVSEYERRKKFRTHQLSARFEDIRSEFASLSKSVDDSVDRSNFLRWSRLADEDQGCRKRKRKLEEDASEMNVERGAKKARDGYHRNAIARLGDDERVLSNSDG